MAQRQHAQSDPQRHQSPDAIAMLKANHQRVRDLFHQYEAATEPHAKREIAARAFVELETHAQLEEHVFYPAVNEETDEGPELVRDAMQDHQRVKTLIAELRAMGADHAAFDATFRVLMANVEHHVDAEEATMFPMAEAELEEDLQDLKEEMQELKAQITAS